jgi:hypothetical protein
VWNQHRSSGNVHDLHDHCCTYNDHNQHRTATPADHCPITPSDGRATKLLPTD